MNYRMNDHCEEQSVLKSESPLLDLDLGDCSEVIFVESLQFAWEVEQHFALVAPVQERRNPSVRQRQAAESRSPSN